MSPAELAAVAAELEPDIRAADNDMREIASLQERGVTGAGSLSGAYPAFLLRTTHANTNQRQTTKRCVHDSRRFYRDTQRIWSVLLPSRSASQRSSDSMPCRSV
jgi:hypothetical protein